ncbi:MAG: amidohydrolase [Actinomycetes bacterium]|nr:MAG: amidohydrolase [Actinomycetes bacterium]
MSDRVRGGRQAAMRARVAAAISAATAVAALGLTADAGAGASAAEDDRAQARPAATRGGHVRPADTILKNARIYTIDEARPRADVVAISGKRIVHVSRGKSRAWRRFIGPRTELVNVRGRPIIPGMVDSHTHPSAVALSSWHIALPKTDDLETILSFVRQYAAEHPPSEVPFIYAEYYPSDMDWGPDGPTAAAIDAYVSDRPVLLQDFSDHASVVNSRMLELMGVDADTPLQIDPEDPGPQFVRGADGVTPTGWVLEGAWRYFAANMYEAIGWSAPSEVTPELLHNFTSSLSEKGVVAVLDAITDEATLAAAAALDEQGRLHVNYHAATMFNGLADLPESIAQLRAWQRKYGGKHVKIRTLKLFLDGTNEIGTSAVLEPFAIGENDYGELRMSEDDLMAAMLRLNAANLDLHIHLVGDRAFRTALNAVRRAQKQLGSAWRMQVTLTHDELIDPADMPRVAKLGVILNWTPHWSGGYFGEAAADWLGWERFNRMYQFNPVIDSGGIVNYGSDVVTQYEAARADPFFGMQVGHTRIDPEYPMQPGPGTVPGTEIRKPRSARLPVGDLLEGYTRNGAIELRLADTMGSIEVGKLANLSILDEDPFKVPDDEIENVEPDAVLFEGRVVQGGLDP